MDGSLMLSPNSLLQASVAGHECPHDESLEVNNAYLPVRQPVSVSSSAAAASYATRPITAKVSLGWQHFLLSADGWRAWVTMRKRKPRVMTTRHSIVAHAQAGTCLCWKFEYIEKGRKYAQRHISVRVRSHPSTVGLQLCMYPSFITDVNNYCIW